MNASEPKVVAGNFTLTRSFTGGILRRLAAAIAIAMVIAALPGIYVLQRQVENQLMQRLVSQAGEATIIAETAAIPANEFLQRTHLADKTDARYLVFTSDGALIADSLQHENVPVGATADSSVPLQDLAALIKNAPTGVQTGYSAGGDFYFALSSLPQGFVAAILSKEVLRSQLRLAVAINLAAGFVVLLVLLGIVATLLRGLIADPIKAMIRTIRQFAGGDYGARMPSEREDELGLMATTFNDMAMNITGREAALQNAMRLYDESKAFNDTILENAMLAVITIADNGEIIGFNSAAEKIFGHSRANTVGREMAALIIPERYRDAHYRGLKRFLDTRESRVLGSQLELSAMRADGSEFPIEMTISVSYFDNKPYFTAFVSDLTDTRNARDELARQQEALRQSEKLSAMGALLAGVAHELNNPLAILMGRAALLEGKITDPLVQKEVQRIRDAAERCGRIVRTFLSMARQRPSERKSVQLNNVVSGALELLGYSLRASGIKISTRLQANMPEVSIDGDQVGQILVNLLINAQQALDSVSGHREILIETGRLPGQQFVRVSDNGPGVADDVRERIFDPFFTTKTEGTGTGVGLSVSRSIAREHGGELSLESDEQGASFFLSLPAGDGGGKQESQARPGGDEPQPGLALIIDDEKEMGELLADVLRSAGYQAVTVTDGRNALDWLSRNSCDFVFCDIRMPDLDGPSVWRELRKQHPQLARRTAFITGDTLSASIGPFLKETGQPCLEKPFTPEDVLALAADIESR
jgi:two-component system NtrC family sensor kinase